MENFVTEVWEKVADLTGQALEELHEDMQLDIDLGIDSLKTMSLWTTVLGVLSDDGVALARTKQGEMLRVKTLGELTDFMVNLNSVNKTSNVGELLLPMAHSQRLFVLSNQLIKSASMCSMVRIKGRIDHDKLQAAWQDVIDSNISLRTVFKTPDTCKTIQDVENILLSNCVAPKLAVRPIREDDIEDVFIEKLNNQWNINEWPLHQFSVYEIANDDAVIVFSNEHIISDGLGNQAVLRNFLDCYENRLLGHDSIAVQDISAEEYVLQVQAINDYKDEYEIDAYKAHVAERGDDRFNWRPASVKETKEKYFKNTVTRLTQAQTQSIQSLAKSKRVPIYSLLLTHWLKAIAKHDSSQNLVVQMPTSGTVYPDCKLHEVVGCWAQNMALTFSRGDLEGSLDDALALVNSKVQEAISCGFDRAQTALMADAFSQGFPMPNGVIPDFILSHAYQSMRSNMYFPYTGDTGFSESYREFSVCDYRAGTCNVAGSFDLLQEIHCGQLTLFANYDGNAFPDESIGNIISDYVNSVIGTAEPSVSPLLNAEMTIGQLVDHANEIISEAVSASDAALDLEYDIGIDSLERIRLSTFLAKSLGNNKLNRKLILCRTLSEILSVINADIKSGEVVSVNKEEAKYENSPTLNIPLRKIEQQALLTPALEAVNNSTESINYQTLNARANQLARVLMAKGVNRGDCVAMLCHRGPDMLVSILAILKAGAAYVPLEPSFPAQRLEYIINHAQVTALVGQGDLLTNKLEAVKLPLSLKWFVNLSKHSRVEHSSQVNCVKWKDIDSESSEPVVVDINPRDLMVVLYTSGSTGNPKGVALNHEGYANRLAWHQKEFKLNPGERVAQKTSCCFDVSVWELLWPLMEGGTVCAIEKEIVANPWDLLDWINAERISVMHFVPSMFSEFVHAIGDEKQSFSALRSLIFSGEALPVAVVKQWIDVQGLDIKLANLYGPTEASIDVTSHIITRRPKENQLRIPIGAAIDNTEMLILNESGERITEEGVVGELYISGVQLAQGYLHDAEKTKAIFIDNPFLDVRGDKIYRTGDIGAWLPNKEIDYRGRIDSQVKLRGFRIELGEIEAVLTDHCGADEAAALIVEVKGQKKLLACYTPKSLNKEVVKNLAAQKITDYMVPQIFISQNALPRNQNGKLDRNQILELFNSGVLTVDEKSDSIANVRKLESPITKDNCQNIDNYSQGLTPSQLGLLQSVEAPFNRCAITRMRYKGVFDVDCFKEAVLVQIERHDALRSIFVNSGHQWRRENVNDWKNFIPTYLDGRSLSDAEFSQCINTFLSTCAKSLRVNAWPLIKIVVAKVSDNITEVAIVCHQIIGDMVTGNLMCQQLWGTYDQLMVGDTPERSVIASGKDLAEKLQEEEINIGRENLVNYWIKELGANYGTFMLAHDKDDGENTYGSHKTCEKYLNKKDSKNILFDVVRQFNVSSYALLASAVYKVVSQKTQENSVIISHRFNGRNVTDGAIYFDSVDGFAIHFPVRLDVKPHDDLANLATDFDHKLKSIPWRGASYDWVGLDLPARCYPERRATAIRINFLGEVDALVSDRISVIDNQNNQRLVDDNKIRPIDIEFWLKIKNGCVGLEVGYSMNQYSDLYIGQLIDDCFTALLNLILENKTSSNIAA